MNEPRKIVVRGVVWTEGYLTPGKFYNPGGILVHTMSEADLRKEKDEETKERSRARRGDR